MTPLDAALSFLAKHPDAKLFPAKWDGDSKKHIGLVKWGAGSSGDPERIRAWAAKWPGAYFCVALKQSGLSVVDVDLKHDKRGDLTLLDLEINDGHVLPETFTVQTPSGGYHHLFKGAVAQRTNGLGPGVDSPGMVPVPGTNAPGKGEYRILNAAPVAPVPEWVRGIVGTPRDRTEKPPAIDLDQEHNVAQAIEIARNTERGVLGERLNNRTYLLACQLRDIGISEPMCAEILEEHYSPRCEPPLACEELERIVANAYRYATGQAGAGTAEADFCGEPIPEAERSLFEEPKALPGPPKRVPITREELRRARITPRCIVRDYLYADVANLTGPGGTSKTSLLLYEAVHIILGLPLYGLEVESPGWVLYVTAEDSREILLGRLRLIMEGLFLTDSQIDAVLAGITFWDVSGEGRKLIRMREGNVVLADTAGQVVEAYRDDPPAVVVIDPAVSFGVGESKINDNEQGLIDAARHIRRGLDCCVRYVSHTGQAAAREKSLDQYTSRGGSAMADGTRMTTVLQPWKPGDRKIKPPAACGVSSPDAALMVLARPKLSYAKPNLPLIWIRRSGWRFDYFEEDIVPDILADETAARKTVIDFLVDTESRGVFYSKSTLKAAYKATSMKRDDLVSTVEILIAEGILFDKPLPIERQTTSRKTYLSVSADFRRVPGFEGQIA